MSENSNAILWKTLFFLLFLPLGMSVEFFDYPVRTVSPHCEETFARRHPDPDPDIVDGGEKVPSLVQISTFFPHVDRSPMDGLICTGTLLSHSWIITSARCTIPHAPDKIKIIFIKQEAIRTPHPEEFRVARRVHNHPSHDLALLSVKPFRTVYPARLPYASRRFIFANRVVLMYGFAGRTDIAQRRLTVLPRCYSDEFLCLQDRADEFFCDGDFGGAVMHHFNMLIGVVSRVEKWKGNITVVVAERMVSHIEFIAAVLNAAPSYKRRVTGILKTLTLALLSRFLLVYYIVQNFKP